MGKSDRRDTLVYVFFGALLAIALAVFFPDQVFAKSASEYSDQCAEIIYPEGAGPQTIVTTDSLEYYRGKGIKGGNPACLVNASGGYVTLESIDMFNTPYGRGLIVYHYDTTKYFMGPLAVPTAARGSKAIPFVSCSKAASGIRCSGNPNAGGVVRLMSEMTDKRMDFTAFEMEQITLTTPDPVFKILEQVDPDEPKFLAGKDFRIQFKLTGGLFGSTGSLRTSQAETSRALRFLEKQEDDYKIEVLLPMKAEGEGYKAISFDKKQLFYMAGLMQAIGQQFAPQ